MFKILILIFCLCAQVISWKNDNCIKHKQNKKNKSFLYNDTTFKKLLSESKKMAVQKKYKSSLRKLNKLYKYSYDSCMTWWALLEIIEIYDLTKKYECKNDARVSLVKIFLDSNSLYLNVKDIESKSDDLVHLIKLQILDIAGWDASYPRHDDEIRHAVFWHDVFLKNFPNDSLTKEVHYNLAGLLMILRDYKRAAYHYNKAADDLR